jgi:malate dehydrogenase
VVLGAGELGGAIASRFAAARIASRLAIVDDAAAVARGKALDIAQAAPITGGTTSITGGSDLSAVIGAAAIIVADAYGPPAVEWREAAGLALIERVAALNQSAPIVCAGADQASLVERGVTEIGLPRTRIFGTAAEALHGAVVGLTALEARCSPADVALGLVGRPPADVIVSWQEGSIAGRSVSAVLTPPALARLDARVPRLWPPGPTAMAGAAVHAVVTALTRSPRCITVLVAVSRQDGGTGRAVMLPATLLSSGIGAVLAPALSARDSVRLDSVLQG